MPSPSYTRESESLDDFIVRNNVRKELASRVKEWVKDYCDAISQNYEDYHIDSLKRNLLSEDGSISEYAKEQLSEIEDGTARLMRFKFKEGRKYYKIIQVEFDDRLQQYRNGSVHSFVDKNTGEVYMAASWSQPAKHVRFDMRIIRERELLHTPSFVTWTSAYLYKR
tara:strand:- start:1068 stop:1568 length:501 start_codon:yes stop_codon:yes gene_type:complete